VTLFEVSRGEPSENSEVLVRFRRKSWGALIGSAFLGAERTYLLGLEKRGVPARQSLRRIGDLIQQLSIVARSSEQLVTTLSGGN
jgi:ABC-type sugar transport system ATPase subunit